MSSSKLPQPVIDEVNEILNKYDRDNNNEITWFEIYDYLLDQDDISNPEVMTMIIFDSLDNNMDGVIQIKEIEQLKLKHYVLEKNVIQDLNKLINKHQITHDYTYEQVLDIVKNNKSYQDPNRVTKIIFKIIDTNNDNIITPLEVKQYIETLSKTNIE